jgi:hypothetical protein
MLCLTEKSGFWIGADGRLKAVDGEFSGILNAKNIILNGTVSAGSNFLLRANADPGIAVDGGSSFVFIRSISTSAKGTCRVVTEVARVGNGAEPEIKYRLTVNGTTAVERIAISGNSYTDDIAIPDNNNRIAASLYVALQ